MTYGTPANASPEAKGIDHNMAEALPDLDSMDINAINSQSSFLPGADQWIEQANQEKAKEKMKAISGSEWFMSQQEAQLYS